MTSETTRQVAELLVRKGFRSEIAAVLAAGVKNSKLHALSWMVSFIVSSNLCCTVDTQALEPRWS